jgi:hypothetical protein
MARLAFNPAFWNAFIALSAGPGTETAEPVRQKFERQ